MAIYKIFPSQDASIYSFYPTMNTGIDPIIEVGNLNLNINPVAEVFRALVKFDQVEIDDILVNKIGSSNYQANFKVYIAEAQGIIFDTYIEVAPISGSWNNGSGTYLDSPYTTNGVSWDYMNYEDGTPWPSSSFNNYVTASYTSSLLPGGGNWFTGSNDTVNPNILVTQSFTQRSYKDINLDVSDIVEVWHTSSLNLGQDWTDIENQGFIIKMEDAVEFSLVDATQPILQLYAVDTNSIYPPILEFKWDDSVYSSSLTEIYDEEIFIGLDNNPGTYYSESVNRFRLNVRPKFPTKTYQTQSAFTDNYKLNSGSMYAVKDLDTNEFVIDFDSTYTKIIADDKGNYFDVYMNGLQPERNYKILIQTTISGSTIVEDNDYNFKVING